MKNAFRRSVISLLIAVSLLGVMGASTAAIAGAQTNHRAAANISRNWHYQLSLPGASGVWDARLKQSRSGKLNGVVDPPFGDCLAIVSGQVTGNSVAMTWKIGGACPAETLKVSGTVNGRHIAGTVVDSLHGSGTFTASPDL